MNNLRTMLIAIVATCMLATSAMAELPAEIKISGNALKLNGAGKRTKTFVQIYESGLYLQKPSRDAKAILEADELMAIRVKITSGFVSRSSLVKSLQESLEKSTGGNTRAIAKETQQFVASLKDEVKKNDIYDFVHVPTKGLYVVKNGSVKGSIPGTAFKKALFGIWLSDAPVDKTLRQAMLSGGNVR